MNLLVRLVDALENLAIEAERIRLLKEFELGVRVEESGSGPYVAPEEDAYRVED